MPKVSQQHRDARRDQILSAARRCFLRDGFHATSMQDLFAEAGLSAGAVYRYFASKDEVILAIAEDNMREVLAMINEVATADPDRSLGEVMAGALGQVQAKNEADGVGGMAILVWSEALRNPALAVQLQVLLAGMYEDFTRLAADHQRAGELPGGAPAEAIARLLVAVMAGSILQLTVLGPDAVSDVGAAARALWPRPASSRTAAGASPDR
ncbi:MAG TPA: TetR/AcrR family transcriptional regulator [Streptosporangiaceae bacterium]|nr:TetR/AcrR family transcriptional regulator [Streptosporangiaceae bacterium]